MTPQDVILSLTQSLFHALSHTLSLTLTLTLTLTLILTLTLSLAANIDDPPPRGWQRFASDTQLLVLSTPGRVLRTFGSGDTIRQGSYLINSSHSQGR